MKNFGYKASILKGTNKVISSSEENWSPVTQGSLIRFDKESIYYEVAGSEQLMYIKDFAVDKNGVLIVPDNTEANLMKGDVLSLSFKIYYAEHVLKINNAGKGYKEGDRLSIKGGKPIFNEADATRKTAVISVDKVNQAGEILSLRIDYKGKFSDFPKGNIELTGGSGSGVTANISFGLYDERHIVEREISSIKVEPNASRVILNHPVSKELSSGKLSVKKWVLRLVSPYAGVNKINVDYHITRDFTPYIKLPMNNEALFNKAMKILDKKIEEIDKKLASSRSGSL